MDRLPFNEDYLVGLLIGDGNIVNKDNQPRFRIFTTNSTYINWLDRLFGDFVWQIEKGKYVYGGEDRNKYELLSEPHPRVNYYADIYDANEIYPLPEGASLSPELVKMWHVSDGTLNWPYGAQNPTLQLATDTKHPEKQRYSQLFSEIDVEMKSSTKQFYFSVDDTKKILSYMGHAVPGFEYKWETNSEEKYKKVKEFAGGNNTS